MSLSTLRIVTMNANGSSDAGLSEKRRKPIENVIVENDLIFFQEFPSENIEDSDIEIPSDYQYTGNKEVSIVYNRNKIRCETVLSKEIDSLSRNCPSDFKPFERAHICRCTIKEANTKFICISWHGRHKGLTKKSDKKQLSGSIKSPDSKFNQKDLFKWLINFLKIAKDTFECPVLVGGDFNIGIDQIQECMTSEFVRVRGPTAVRRENKKLIDYFILSDCFPYHPKIVENIEVPENIFDHVPVLAIFQVKDRMPNRNELNREELENLEERVGSVSLTENDSRESIEQDDEEQIEDETAETKQERINDVISETTTETRQNPVVEKEEKNDIYVEENKDKIQEAEEDGNGDVTAKNTGDGKNREKNNVVNKEIGGKREVKEDTEKEEN